MFGGVFIATGVRAILLGHVVQFTQGEAEEYNMPKMSANTARCGCVSAVLGRGTIVMLISLVAHESEASTDEYANFDPSHVKRVELIATILCATHYIVMITIPDGSTGVTRIGQRSRSIELADADGTR